MKTFGYMTVVSKVGPKRYLCVCVCGNAEIRRSKTINNPSDHDCCQECKEKAFKNRQYRFKRGLHQHNRKHYIDSAMSKINLN